MELKIFSDSLVFYWMGVPRQNRQMILWLLREKFGVLENILLKWWAVTFRTQCQENEDYNSNMVEVWMAWKLLWGRREDAVQPKKENKWKYTYCVYKVGGLTFCLCRMQESQVTINSRYVIEMWKPWIGCLLVYAHKHGSSWIRAGIRVNVLFLFFLKNF